MTMVGYIYWARKRMGEIWNIIIIPWIPTVNKYNNISDKATDDNSENKAVVETVDTVDLRKETDVSQPE